MSILTSNCKRIKKRICLAFIIIYYYQSICNVISGFYLNTLYSRYVVFLVSYFNTLYSRYVVFLASYFNPLYSRYVVFLASYFNTLYSRYVVFLASYFNTLYSAKGHTFTVNTDIKGKKSRNKSSFFVKI